MGSKMLILLAASLVAAPVTVGAKPNQASQNQSPEAANPVPASAQTGAPAANVGKRRSPMTAILIAVAVALDLGVVLAATGGSPPRSP